MSKLRVKLFKLLIIFSLQRMMVLMTIVLIQIDVCVCLHAWLSF